jgi:hypothetical protein
MTPATQTTASTQFPKIFRQQLLQLQTRLRSGAVADKNDRIVLRPIRHQTLAREIARGLRMARVRAVLGAVIDLCALDVREDLTCAVMEGADRAAFYPMRLEPGSIELLHGVTPVGKPAQFSWPPAEQSWYEDDVV